MTTTATARSKTDAPKPEKLTGLWVGTTRGEQAKCWTSFTDLETLRRYELRAGVEYDHQEPPEEFDVFAATAGSTEEGKFVTSVRCRESTGKVRFMSFTDVTTRRRYVVYHNATKRMPGSPDWSACIDRTFGLPRPRAERQEARQGA